MPVPEPTPICAVASPEPSTRTAESRTWWVVGLTAVTMLLELVVGYWTHSLALTADGWHMMTHVAALSLSGVAYWFARTRSSDRRFTFGTGKVYALAGYSSALLLAVVGLSMVVAAFERFVEPENISFAEALPVAIFGLLINFVCAWLLRDDHSHHGHSHEHSHTHEHHHDHNRQAAYIHVVADALTSVLAIAALVAGYTFHINWLDAAVGLLGGFWVSKWAVELCQESAKQLLDVTPKSDMADKVRSVLESFAQTRVTDLHVWQIGPGKLVAVASVTSAEPQDVGIYRNAVLSAVPLTHLTVEIVHSISS